VNSTLLVRGREEEPSAPIDFGDTEPVLLFPHEGVPVLEPSERPVTLVVPDGNWRQASKVRARVPGMKDVRCVTLPPGPPSIYRLRAEAHETGLATVEAIARAMAILEGPHVHDALLHVFRTMVERTLWVRGTLRTDEVTGGLPPGVTKHDPVSGLPST
jgi:DTW domain-containing protein YfiP